MGMSNGELPCVKGFKSTGSEFWSNEAAYIRPGMGPRALHASLDDRLGLATCSPRPLHGHHCVSAARSCAARSLCQFRCFSQRDISTSTLHECANACGKNVGTCRGPCHSEYHTSPAAESRGPSTCALGPLRRVEYDKTDTKYRRLLNTLDFGSTQ